MIVDTHHHLWLIDESDLWWLSDDDRAAGGPHLKDFGPEEMRKAFGSVGTERSVLYQGSLSEIFVPTGWKWPRMTKRSAR